MIRPLDVRVLGSLEVRAFGEPVTVAGAKPRTLLTLLGLYPDRVVTADVLLEVLWGDEMPRTAAKALQTHVSTIRRALGESAVLTRGAGWALAVAPTDVDRFGDSVDSARRAMAAGDAARSVAAFDDALDLWRGAPELPPTPRGRAEVARWVETHASVVEDRFDARLATGVDAGLVAELEHAVAETPLRERRWRQLMLALYRAGRQADALEAYRRVRQTLADELAVDPGPELRALEAAILRHDPALVLTAAPPQATARLPDDHAGARVDSRRLIGRRREWKRFDEAFATAAARESRVLLVTGDAGIGKTRLVDEVTRRIARDWLVVRGNCVEAGQTGLPYAPLSGILTAIADTAAGERLLAETSRRSPGLLPLVQAPSGEVPIDTTAGLAQLRLFDAMVRLFGRLSADQPTLAVIEDLHWADKSTRAFLSFCCRNLVPRRFAIVVTTRTDELHRTHPLRPLLSELAHLPAATTIEVGPLGEDEIADLVADRHSAPVPHHVVCRIVDRSGGNPFFAEQLCAIEYDRADRRVPHDLADVLLHRIDRLGDGARRVLRAGSLAGQRVSHELLTAVLDEDDEFVTAAVRECADHHILEPDADREMYRFRHALLAEAIVSELLPAERRSLHRRLADALAERAPAAVVSRHLLGAGDLRGAFAASATAAREALAVAAPGDALAHWERVLDLWPEVTAADRSRIGSLSWVALRAAASAQQAGEISRSAALARTAINEADNPRDRALARLELAPLLTPLVTGDVGDEAASAEAAIDEAPDDPALQARGRYVLARARLFSGAYDEAVVVADQAYTENTALGAMELALGAKATAYLARCQLGRANPAEEVELARAARECGDVEIGLWVLTRLADWWWPTDPSQAQEYGSTAYDYAVEHGVRTSIRGIWARETLTLCRWLTGSWDLVDDLARDDPLAIHDATAGAVALECQVDVARGRLAAARRRLDRAERVTSDVLGRAFIAVVQTDLELAQKQPAAAISVCRQALDAVPPPSGFADFEPVLLAKAMNALADAKDLAIEVDESSDLLAAADRLTAREKAGSRLTRLSMSLLRAHRARLIDDDPAPWRAALAIRGQHPYETAECRYRLARALLARGDAAGASRELTLAAKVSRELGAAILLDRIQALASHGLTPPRSE